MSLASDGFDKGTQKTSEVSVSPQENTTTNLSKITNTRVGENDNEVFASSWIDLALLSPSPRGIETWGPCSPFNLPNSSMNIELFEPTEMSKILDVSFSESPSELDYVSKDSHRQPLIGSGAHDFEMDVKRSRNALELEKSANSGVDEKASHPGMSDMAGVSHSATVHPETGCHLTKLHTHGEGIDLNEFPKWPEAKLNSDSTFKMKKDGQDGITDQEDLAQDQQGVSETTPRKEASIESNLHNESIRVTRIAKCGNASKEWLNEPPKRDAFILKKTSQSSLENSAEVIPKEPTRRDAQISGKQLTDEEIKRIRRVKNRASVEKCRTKQRLRMEALQSELKVLQSENQTLRGLTSWMDSRVNIISSELTKMGRNERGDVP